MEDDLIIGDPEPVDNLDIIESQLTVITTVMDTDNDLYDEFLADKIKVVSRALRIIHKIQASIIKGIN